MKINLLFGLIILSLIGCNQKNKNCDFDKEFEIDGKRYAIDTLLISESTTESIKYFDETDIESSLLKSNYSTNSALALYKSNSAINDLMIEKSNNFVNSEFVADWNNMSVQTDYLKSKNLDFAFLESNCYENKPKSIRDLTAGLSLRAYKFDKDNQGSLSLFGFANVEIGRKESVVLLEFLQTGNHICESNPEIYGVGARMMMKITSKKRRAKINSPQQISASVTFGLAEVEFSMKTIGITGPGTANLVNQGSMTENTYSNFLKSVSNLIVDAYKAESSYFIDPQLIPKE